MLLQFQKGDIVRHLGLLDLQRTTIAWWQMRQAEIAGRIGHFLFDLRTRN